MAGSYVDFVEDLIYGTGLAPNPNHQDWLAANPSPSGLTWLDHHLDRMLAAYQTWLQAEGLPPVTPWDGVRRAPWDPALDLPLGSDLDGSFTGVVTLDDLGLALLNRYTLVAAGAQELNGLEKAPFSYRYWSYLKWAWQMRERFQGRQVFPVGSLYDRDGTPLSATPFSDTFNDLHRTWHVGLVGSGVPTPGLRSTAGQRSQRGLPGMDPGEEFLRFHREHMELFHRWLARTAQPPLRPIDMGHAGGWPPTGAPPTSSPAPWAFDEAATGASGLPGMATVNDVGSIEGGYHGSGHGWNSDIGPLSHNNYVPRFHNWHGWIDSQWWWREPRFAESDPVTSARTRIFHPVLQDGSDFLGLPALSIVRDPLLPADTLYPANALGAFDFTTGNGTLRMQLYVRDPFGRTLRMRLTAEVLDAAGAVVPGLTIVLLRTIGPGGDHPLDTLFTEDLAFSGAFLSDDPARANPAVGFVHSRVRVTGHLWEPDAVVPDDPALSPDSGFVHEDIVHLDLVREKLAPDVQIFQDLSSFSQDQVDSAMSGGQARFENAFYVVAQDRTAASVPAPTWPPEVADEVKGLLLGRSAASGLFDDLAHAPEVVLWQESVDAPFTGVTVELVGSPAFEDPALPPELPQRLTWSYAIVFATGHDAFDGLATGDQRLARLRATVADRASNLDTFEAQVKLFMDANPYMTDGPTSWLSVDTRSFAISEGQTRLGETIVAGQPLPYLAAILGRLNAGTTGAETFDTLAQSGPGAALEYAAAIPDPSTGTSTSIYNFALAKVRLQGAAGAASVRAFFRLFRYAAPSLLFDEQRGYRFHDDGAGRVVPLLGFESETPGAALMSVPFFAAARADTATVTMDDQLDPSNVHTFPAGPAGERIWYFGAWLDINDPNARLPQTYAAVSPDGPFPIMAVQSLRTLMRDFHQCMVVEIRYDGDPTEPLASPAGSDNLAQRNLVILESDNPGDAWTRTVEHSFALDLRRPARTQVVVPDRSHGGDHGHDGDHGGDPCPVCGHQDRDSDGCCVCCGCAGMRDPLTERDSAGFVSTFKFERLVADEAMSIAMRTAHVQEPGHDHDLHGGDEHGQGHGHDPDEILRRFGAQAALNLCRTFPFVFHPARWSQTAALVDELMIRWNDLPPGSEARLFLPGVAAETIVSLRNLRHAPGTVRAEGDAVLRLKVGGVTYLPIPPVPGDRLAGLLSITLPEGVQAGQRFTVDVSQLRAGSSVQNGGFRVEVLIGKAAQLVDAATRGVELLQEQLSLAPAQDRWRPILAHRLQTERRRAAALAARAGRPWRDPTVWHDAHGHEHPVQGLRIRVVLEEIVILDDRDPWLKGAGEIDFDIRVRSEDNGGVEQRTRLPQVGHYALASGQRLALNATIFEGYADAHLAIRIDAMERDSCDPDDNLGSYTRVFMCDATRWLGRYRPGDEAIDPEQLGYWQVTYRIERG